MKDLTFRQKVIQGIHDLFYIWKREFGTTFRDQGVLIFFVLVPLVYPLIYAFIYTNETIHEVPTVVVDDSRSSLSREYLRKVDSSPEAACFLSKWFKNMVLKFFTHSNSGILAVKLKQYMPVIHLGFIIAEQYLSFFFIIPDSITYDVHKDSF